MAVHRVTFNNNLPIQVPTGTLVTEAASLAGIEIGQPCGGQGRCGRCAVQVESGAVRSRSTLRLSEMDIQEGYVLACQALVEGDVAVKVLPGEKVERRMTTERSVGAIAIPAGYDPAAAQTIRRIPLTLIPPSMDDQTDDWGRFQRALRAQADIPNLQISLNLLRKLGEVLRDAKWEVTAVIDTLPLQPRLIDLSPGHQSPDTALWGAAIDIGTTTVSVWLVDLRTGAVRAQVAEYNQQIARGEDVISRIIYASKNGHGAEMQKRVVDTINELVARACKRVLADPQEIVKATIAGNSTMIHLLLNIPATSIRLNPFVTTINEIPALKAEDIGLELHPEATIDCLPGVASYVGADISAGVLSSGVDDSEMISLFMDIGTNGETVLGSREWLVTCACSAGPAFEGAGVLHGMRASKGAIEEVWVNSHTYEPTYRVIGGGKPRGLCGSGLISLLAELFLTGVLDKGGNLNTDLLTERVREGKHGLEYVIVWGSETKDGADIVITHVDIDNLVRAKAAIYAGFTVLADSVGLSLDAVEQVLIGGAFGKYINVEKAVEIGLLPDMPWEQFHFLGNTAVLGAYRSLLDQDIRVRISEIARRMTYIELSADNAFYDAFTSALFLPHTDLAKFPSVTRELVAERGHQS